VKTRESEHAGWSNRRRNAPSHWRSGHLAVRSGLGCNRRWAPRNFSSSIGWRRLPPRTSKACRKFTGNPELPSLCEARAERQCSQLQNDNFVREIPVATCRPTKQNNDRAAEGTTAASRIKRSDPMRVRIAVLACFGVGALLVTGWRPHANALAQSQGWVPVVARHRLTYARIASDGTESPVSQTDGRWLRSSDGNTLIERGPVVNGIARPPTAATLLAKAAGAVYEISYGSHTATKQVLCPLAHPIELTAAQLAEAQERSVGAQTINGVACLGFPVIDGRNGSTVGTAWRSFPYDLEVRSDQILALNGSRTHMVSELYDIQIGVEPPKGSTALPSDLAISDAGAPSQLHCP
jgi:hypothetical protein